MHVTNVIEAPEGRSALAEVSFYTQDVITVPARSGTVTNPGSLWC